MPMFVIVVGGGKVGTYLTSMLLNAGYRARLIEARQEELPRLKRELPEDAVVWGNGTDPNVLESAGIRQAQVVAAVTGGDETNLVVASLARFEFGVARVIGRVNNPKNAWLFGPDMGVDVALNQADLMARMIAEEMSLGDVMILMKLRKGQYSLVEEKVHPDSQAVGRTIAGLHLPMQSVLLAVIRKGELIMPHGDTVLQSADEVLALVHSSQLATFAALLARRV